MATETLSEAGQSGGFNPAEFDFEALLTEEDIDVIEGKALEPVHGQLRRAALALLMNSKSQLMSNSADAVKSAEVYVELVERFRDEQQHLENCKEQIAAAEARCVVILNSLVARHPELRQQKARDSGRGELDHG